MIGVDLDVDAVTTLLTALALTDAELALGPQVWATWTSRLDEALER